MALRLIPTLVILLTFTLLASGCADSGAGPDSDLVQVVVTDTAGTKHRFNLEPALNDTTRIQGLSNRTEIAADGGMAFFFTRAAVQNFVMRDCPIPIDIVYVDRTGRVVAHHAMVPEDPQRADESDAAYNRRLRRYSSRFGVPIVLEFDGGTIERLGIAEGDVIEIKQLEAWRKRAQ